MPYKNYEDTKEWSNKYYQKMKSNKEYREQKKKYQKEWVPRNRERIKEYNGKRNYKWKMRVYNELGAFCNRCGENDIRCLQIDHVNGDGNKEQNHKHDWSYYKKVYDKILTGSHDYQILCANCNWIKRDIQKEYN